MPELTQEQINKIDKGMDTVIKLETVLLGANGDPGLVGTVAENCVRIDGMDKRQDAMDTRLTKVEVKSGFIALIVSAVTSIGAGIGSWFANKGG